MALAIARKLTLRAKSSSFSSGMASTRPNGAPIGDRASVRGELAITDGQFLVGRIGRVDPQKDLPTFIAAVQMAAAHQPEDARATGW